MLRGKTDSGRFFEDFRLGQVLHHATPRTLGAGESALYTALYGSRFALNSSDPFARNCGLPSAPIDDLLVFHIIFGKSVADVSLNAVANLGYAACRFGVKVYSGDTLTASSTVIGLKEVSNGKAGIVWIRSIGINQRGETVLEFVRWVMVNKRNFGEPRNSPIVPNLPKAVNADDLPLPVAFSVRGYDRTLAGSVYGWSDYTVGEKIDHVDGATIEEADHMLAARLYQNLARVHFDQYRAEKSQFGRRITYGGHIISLARSLSYNGLANAFRFAAINSGAHLAPCFAGDTIYAWTKVLAKSELAANPEVGALRLRTIATKNLPCTDFPDHQEDGKIPHSSAVLDLDYWVLMPR